MAKEEILEGPLRYCLYARKSSEQDERQALSIDSQIKEMLATAERDGVEVVETIKESHSAKDSGQRPAYVELLQRIRAGEFNGILTWAPDRLSRNAGDLGSLVDLMDQGLLKEIRTHGQIFRNSPNEKFLLMILCSQAKLENDNKGVNVKRGMRTKCEMGWRPGVAPLGYLNIKEDNTIRLDPERAPIIKEMFNKVAKQGYSGRDILNWLNTETSFVTRSGKKLALSSIFLILKTTFYYGEYTYGEETYQGKHEPLITKELFDEVQVRISRPAHGRHGEKCFAFTKLMTCGECGAGITAEEKFKRLKNGDMKRHVYYHCTDSKRVGCKQPYIRESDLIEQFVELIDKLKIDQIGMKEKLQEEIDRYNKFTQGVLGLAPEESKLPKVDLKLYAKYILREGKPEEKREILNNLQNQIRLTDGTIQLLRLSN
jgi:DNA invertase Pin-like site-specific DNA recombinase